MISLSAVCGAGVEDDLAVEGARLRVPVRRVRQVTHVSEESKIRSNHNRFLILSTSISNSISPSISNSTTTSISNSISTWDL